jgi:hypothetical protein
MRFLRSVEPDGDQPDRAGEVVILTGDDLSSRDVRCKRLGA